MSNTVASALVRLLLQLVLLPLIALMVPLAFALAWGREALRDLLHGRPRLQLAPVRLASRSHRSHV